MLPEEGLSGAGLIGDVRTDGACEEGVIRELGRDSGGGSSGQDSERLEEHDVYGVRGEWGEKEGRIKSLGGTIDNINTQASDDDCVF